MAVRAYVLVDCAEGTVKECVQALVSLQSNGASVISADSVMGPFDIMVLVEAGNPDEVVKLVESEFSDISGITKTTTCVVLNQER
jgi:DNA-binding Lrp family transcriptional regulator